MVPEPNVNRGVADQDIANNWEKQFIEDVVDKKLFIMGEILLALDPCVTAVPHMAYSHFAGHIISLELIICLFLTAN